MNPSMKKISVLMAIAWVDMLGAAMVFPLIPFYALRFHAQPQMVGWIIACFPIAQLASSPIWGRVSDRYGRRPALLIGLSFSAIGFLVFASATNVWLLLLSRLVQGAGGGTTGVAQAYVGDSIAREERAKALGWLSAATNAGVAIGPVIGSLASGISHEAPGLIAAAVCIINVGLAWRWLPESKAAHVPPDPTKPKMRSIRAAIWDVLRNPGTDVPILVWIYAIGMLGNMSMSAVLALYLGAEFNVTVKTIGYVFTYIATINIVMRALLLGRIVDRLGETATMRAGAIMLMIGVATLPLSHHIAFLALSLAAVPIGTTCLFPATSALVTHRAPKLELGQVLGVQQAFGAAARIVAPIWATRAFQDLGHGVPFYLTGGIVAIVVGLAFKIHGEWQVAEVV
jgi:MFS family permease